jgi:hypothetical protein
MLPAASITIYCDNLPTSATAVEGATTVEAGWTTYGSFRMEAPDGPMPEVSGAVKSRSRAGTETRMAPDTRMAVEARTSVESRMAVEAMEPRAGANEYAPDEPIWTVVAIRGAGVRVIRIVAIGANRRWADNWGANADADRDSLGVCVRCRHKANTKYRENP